MFKHVLIQHSQKLTKHYRTKTRRRQMRYPWYNIFKSTIAYESERLLNFCNLGVSLISPVLDLIYKIIKKTSLCCIVKYYSDYDEK